ncbi:hypothetical protein AMAG_10199 [Allomyces macrogynus ATCC 38327]|uniref:Uncharacterized protein n=1 Tax=Allomyces macrogynus (strain ATCC 38327) TaxID=578462 RepID=A0A0L0SR62_ALLM3|nr:hypothetical protein AMAG_10199 [Allomyces macrogynus ATCC 38327]|eukprot:KNE64865.1 hypothetical protein AMAG_10199 [Allomyces macrogynus ATCC 38327]
MSSRSNRHYGGSSRDHRDHRQHHARAPSPGDSDREPMDTDAPHVDSYLPAPPPPTARSGRGPRNPRRGGSNSGSSSRAPRNDSGGYGAGSSAAGASWSHEDLLAAAPHAGGGGGGAAWVNQVVDRDFFNAYGDLFDERVTAVEGTGAPAAAEAAAAAVVGDEATQVATPNDEMLE